MASFVQDLRHGFRLLLRQRGFTMVAALVLALGIGANTAVFSLVNSLVLKPRPGAPDVELAGIYSRDRTQPDRYRAFSYPNYADLRARSDLFRSLTAHTFSLAPALEAAGVGLERAYPGENEHQSLMMAPLARLSVSTSPQTDSELGVLAVLLFSMSGLVLLVASLNLANMLLARGSARRKEFAIRLALGGSRGRVARQLLTESLALSLIGGVLATFVAWAATRLVGASLATRLPLNIELDPSPDARLLVATVIFCVVSVLFFGLGPAWRHARTDALPELKEQAGELGGRRRSTWLGASRRFFATRDWLVMGQLALSLVTLTAAGLFVRAALESASADPGFTFDRGIVANVDPTLGGRTRDQTQQFYEQALGRLRAMPGVAGASFASLMAFGEFTESQEVQRAGAPIRGRAGTRSVTFGSDTGVADTLPGLVDAVATSVGADYFKTIGLAVTRGREFLPSEEFATGGTRLAIIDETLAAKLFGSETPVGQQVQYSKRQSPDVVVLQVVGVVAATRHQLLEHEMRPHIFMPFGQEFRSAMYLHVRTNAASADAEVALLPRVRQALVAIDPMAPVLSLETLPMYRDRNLVLWALRAGANTFLAFGSVAVFMCAIGVYGVKAYVVARRTREIGIRLALGATPRNVVSMVLRDGAVPGVAGLTVGLGLSVLAGGLVRGMLFGDSRFDAPVVLGAVVVLTATALLASWLPARRATRIAATQAMKN